MVKLQIKLSKPDDLTLLNNAASAISEPIGVRLYTDQKQAQPFLDKIGKMIITH